MCGLGLSMVNLPGAESFKKNRLCLPIAITVNSFVRHVTLCSSSFSVLGFHLAGASIGLMNAAKFYWCESFAFGTSRNSPLLAVILLLLSA